MGDVVQLEEAFTFSDLSDEELEADMAAVLQEIRTKKAEANAIMNELSRRGRRVEGVRL